MGSAQSSNTAKAIAEVANSVTSNTSTSNAQVASIYDRIKAEGCSIRGDVNINIASQVGATNAQIVKAFQQTHIQNSIAQQMQQLAQSTVGSLGIGIADANNYVSTYASASTDISNYVFTASSQSTFEDTTVLCENSVIGGDFNVDLSYTNSFWNDQGVSSNQINDIANSITQKVSQTATAKVVGLTGLLIILAIIIGIIGYALSKPVGAAAKSLGPAMGIISIVVIIIIITFMYIKATPPFFSDQQTCSPSGNLGGSTCSFNNCLNSKTQTVSLDKPPLKYMYNIIGTQQDTTKSKRFTIDGVGMLNMIVYSSNNSSNYEYNQGYNALSCMQWAQNTTDGESFSIGWNKDTTHQAYGVPQLPNPFRLVKVSVKVKDSHQPEDVYCITPTTYNFSGDFAGNSNTPSVYEGPTTTDPTYDDKLYIKIKDFNDNYKSDTDKLLQITAELNAEGWKQYFNLEGNYTYNSKSLDEVNKEKKKRALHARYILTLASGLDNSVYIFDGTDNNPAEEVSYMSKTILSNTDEAKLYCYKYNPDQIPQNFENRITESTTGSLTGKIGVCNTRQNKLKHFFGSVGNWIILVIGIIILGFLIYLFVRKIMKRKD